MLAPVLLFVYVLSISLHGLARVANSIENEGVE